MMKGETTIKSALISMVLFAALMGGFGVVYTNALDTYGETPDPVFVEIGPDQISSTLTIAEQISGNLTAQDRLPGSDPTGIFDITAVYVFDFANIIADIPNTLGAQDGILSVTQRGLRDVGLPDWVWVAIGAMISIYIGLKVGAFIFRRIGDL